MDKLTWLSIAKHQPRRATWYGNDENDHECAACSVAVNHAMEMQSGASVWEMTHKASAPSNGVGRRCVGCGHKMEYHDAP